MIIPPGTTSSIQLFFRLTAKKAASNDVGNLIKKTLGFGLPRDLINSTAEAARRSYAGQRQRLDP
jgi:hypothetical protein